MDLESRYGYFHTSVSTDIAGVMKAQRESSFSMEKFVSMVDQRTDMVEDQVENRLEVFAQQLSEAKQIGGSGGQVDIEAVTSNLDQFKFEHKKSLGKIGQLSEKLKHFRNEILSLFESSENSTQQKISSLQNAINAICRHTGAQNPLI